MKRLSDSFIFNEAIKNSATKNAIKSLSIEKDSLNTQTDLYEPMLIINKRVKFAGKNDVVNAISMDKIKFIHNPLIKIPTYLNSMLTMNNGKLTAMVNLTNFSRGTENIDIYPKTLFALAQNGFISLEMNTNWSKHVNNVNELKLALVVYSQLFCKVLDKLYAIKIDQFKSDLIHFLVAKFFLINMCGKVPGSIVDDLAYQACFNKSQFHMILGEAEEFDVDSFSNIHKFLLELSNINMYGLNIRVFLENWARMFGDPTVLAIDYLPSFYSVVFSTAVTGNIGKDYIIESIVGNQIELLYREFFKSV